MLKLTMEKFNNLQVGDCVCDMHDGIMPLDVNLEVVDFTQWPANGGAIFLEKNLGRMYCNKNAIVVYIGHHPFRRVVVNYSYDDRFFGVFTIQPSK